MVCGFPVRGLQILDDVECDEGTITWYVLVHAKCTVRTYAYFSKLGACAGCNIGALLLCCISSDCLIQARHSRSCTLAFVFRAVYYYRLPLGSFFKF